MKQNTSHAVMSQRKPKTLENTLDYFPTPPWAARALCEHVLGGIESTAGLTAWEPACGAGHLAYGLHEYFRRVFRSDIADYSEKEVSDEVKLHGGQEWTGDFLGSIWNVPPHLHGWKVDWIITNPPFLHSSEFVRRAMILQPRRGVAMLLRTQWIHSHERFALFRDHQLSSFHPFVERVPMVLGRVDRRASTATDYAWFVWRTDIRNNVPGFSGNLIPPCRDLLEAPGDYDLQSPRRSSRSGTAAPAFQMVPS